MGSVLFVSYTGCVNHFIEQVVISYPPFEADVDVNFDVEVGIDLMVTLALTLEFDADFDADR